MADDRIRKVPIEGEKDIYIRESDPLNWFEELYSAGGREGSGVPWASMETHPIFAAWLEGHPVQGDGKSALVVGCGMGDDAIELEARGFEVTAFDVSESAMNYCRERFPDSGASFVQADLFDPPTGWTARFDFVLEIYTVQAVPPVYEAQAIENIANFVAPGGQLLVIAEVGKDGRSFEKGPPWLLTPHHVESFASHGLEVSDRHIGEMDENGMTSFTTTFASPR